MIWYIATISHYQYHTTIHLHLSVILFPPYYSQPHCIVIFPPKRKDVYKAQRRLNIQVRRLKCPQKKLLFFNFASLIRWPQITLVLNGAIRRADLQKSLFSVTRLGLVLVGRKLKPPRDGQMKLQAEQIWAEAAKKKVHHVTWGHVVHGKEEQSRLDGNSYRRVEMSCVLSEITRIEILVQVRPTLFSVFGLGERKKEHNGGW